MARAAGIAPPFSALTSPSVAAAAAMTLLAWAVLMLLQSAGGHGHEHASGLAATFLMWNVMMVAMMLPSLTPWLGLFPRAGAALFSAGYFLVWSLYCLAAALVQVTAGDALVLPRPAGGVLLLAAGLFELTPLKAACLRRCRSPIGQLLTRWRSGSAFYFRMGLAHGVTCLGCCWALMALALALGVMNLWWMAALTAVVAVEKLAPHGDRLSRGLGLALIGCGVFLVLT